MSISGAVFIVAVAAVRAALINRLPKQTFLVLWAIVLFRLLIPFCIPSKISLYSWMPQLPFVSDEMGGRAMQAEESEKNNRSETKNDIFLQNDQNQLTGQEKGRDGLYQGRFGQYAFDGGSLGNDHSKSMNKENLDHESLNKEDVDAEGLNNSGLNGDRFSESSINKDQISSQSGLHFGQSQDRSISAWMESYFMQAVYERFGNRGIYVLEIAWAVGCVLFLLFFIVSYVKCILNFSVSVPVENDFCLYFIKNHSGRRKIQVRQSTLVKAPLTYGLLHPVILMPENTDWENQKQLEYIFAHEYTHIRRFDLITKIILVAALSIHWFNPFVWMMYILCNRDLELSCDEAVVHAFGESAKSDYARVLIDMEEQKKRMLPLCSSFSKNAMEERIVAIMKIKKRTIPAAVAAAVLVCGVSGIFATSAAASVQNGENSQSEAEHTLLNAGNKMPADRETGAAGKMSEDSDEVNSDTGSRGSADGSKAADGKAAADDSMTAGSIMAAASQSEGGSTSAESDNIKITNISLNLSNGQAKTISDAVYAHMETKYKGIYALSNYSVRFSNEVVKEEMLTLDIDVSVNMMLIRNPKKSPFVQGMKEAVKETKGAKRKKAARKLYKDYLKEIMPYYMKPDPYDTGFSYLVQIPVSSVGTESSDFEFELFYRSDIDGEILGTFEEEAVFTDGFSKEDGKNYIKENL